MHHVNNRITLSLLLKRNMERIEMDYNAAERYLLDTDSLYSVNKLDKDNVYIAV